MPQPDNLTAAQVVARWNDAVTTGTLANWRVQEKGPPFIKFGSRVRYPLASLVKWEANNLHHDNDNEKTEPITK